MSENDTPDFSKPLSRFNSAYWAMEAGIAAKLDPAAWKLLTALYSYLPDVHPGRCGLERKSGLSPSGVKKARQQLKRAGLISYPDDLRGGSQRTTTRYTVADIRQPAVRDDVLRHLTGSQSNPVTEEPGSTEALTGSLSTPLGVTMEPRTGSQSGHEVLNISAQGSTQRSSEAFGASGPGDPAGRIQPDAPLDSSKASVTVGSVPTASKKSERLSNGQITAICASIDSMKLYLLYGNKAIAEPNEPRQPTPLNWLRFRLTDDPNDRDVRIAEWTNQTFMGYYWYCVSLYQVHKGAPLKLPMWGRLAGDVKNLKQTMANSQLFQLIVAYAQYFDLIKWMCGKAGHALEFNEASLSNGMIRGAANSILQMSEQDRQKIIADFCKANNR